MVTFLPTGDIQLPHDHLGCGIDWTAVGAPSEKIKNTLDGYMAQVQELAQGYSDLLRDPDRKSEDKQRQEIYWKKLIQWFNHDAPKKITALIESMDIYITAGDGVALTAKSPRHGDYGEIARGVIKALCRQYDSIYLFAIDLSECTEIPFYLNPTAEGAEKLDLGAPLVYFY